MRLPLIGRARVKALHNTNPVPVIGYGGGGDYGAGPEHAAEPETTAVTVGAAPAEDVLEAADWIGYNKAGRPYDKRTGRLIKQGRM